MKKLVFVGTVIFSIFMLSGCNNMNEKANQSASKTVKESIFSGNYIGECESDNTAKMLLIEKNGTQYTSIFYLAECSNKHPYKLVNPVDFGSDPKRTKITLKANGKLNLFEDDWFDGFAFSENGTELHHLYNKGQLDSNKKEIQKIKEVLNDPKKTKIKELSASESMSEEEVIKWINEAIKEGNLPYMVYASKADSSLDKLFNQLKHQVDSNPNPQTYEVEGPAAAEADAPAEEDR